MATKKWYQSKTIWGIVVAFIGFVLNYSLKVDLDIPQNADLTTIQNHIANVKNAGSNFNSILSEILAFVGTLFAIYGRITAESKLK